MLLLTDEPGVTCLSEVVSTTATPSKLRINEVNKHIVQLRRSMDFEKGNAYRRIQDLKYGKRNLRHVSSKNLCTKTQASSRLLRFQKSPFSSPRKRSKIFSSTLAFSHRFEMSTLKVDFQSVLHSLSIAMFVSLTRWNSNRCYSLQSGPLTLLLRHFKLFSRLFL